MLKILRLENLDAFDIKKKLNDKHKVAEDKTLAAIWGGTRWGKKFVVSSEQETKAILKGINKGKKNILCTHVKYFAYFI